MKSLMVFVLVAVLAASVWFLWKWTRPHATSAPPADPVLAADPRLTFPTPYRNVRPEVKYVGDAECANCHDKIASTYHDHPMGRSIAVISKAVPIERFDVAAHNPFEKFSFDFGVEQSGHKVFHKAFRRDAAGKEALALAHEAQYVVGSGTHGRAYLTSLDNHIYETPINWFSQGKRWDLAPNLSANHQNHFFRPVDPLCIYCHANQAEPIADSLNHYRAPLPEHLAIGCERCHGPGQLHVERRMQGDHSGGMDDTIVNPRRLEPALRESVCQQCHLQGRVRVARRGRELYDFRPGLPFHLFWSVFVQPPEQTQDHKAVSHVEQMYASKCFLASKGKLGCISCHDPHVFPKPEEKAAVYRAACLKCHQETSCQVPVDERKAQNGDRCAACHMPRIQSTDVAHTATSDHRIPRRAGQSFTVQGGPKRRFAEAIPLVHFHEALLEPGDKEPIRDFALGLVEIAEPMPRVPAKTQFLLTALPLLDAALKDVPDDVPALHARGYALWVQQFRTEAMESFEAALRKSPKREATLSYAAQLAGILGRRDVARSYWEQALAANPHAHSYHTMLAKFYEEDQDWPKVLEHCRVALRINPLSVDARVILLGYYIENGLKDQARAEFEKLAVLEPQQAEMLRQRFEERLK